MRLEFGWSPDQFHAITTATISNLAFPVIELYNILKKRGNTQTNEQLNLYPKLYFETFFSGVLKTQSVKNTAFEAVAVSDTKCWKRLVK